MAMRLKPTIFLLHVCDRRSPLLTDANQWKRYIAITVETVSPACRYFLRGRKGIDVRHTRVGGSAKETTSIVSDLESPLSKYCPGTRHFLSENKCSIVTFDCHLLRSTAFKGIHVRSENEKFKIVLHDGAFLRQHRKRHFISVPRKN